MSQPTRRSEASLASDTATLHSLDIESPPKEFRQPSYAASLNSFEQQDLEKIATDPSHPSTLAPHQQSDKDVASTSQPPTNTTAHDPSSFPDGGARAWLVIMGAFFAMFVSFGWINCIGVFQTYYQTDLLSTYSSEEIAWIPSLEAFMMFIGGIWVGRLYDNYGPRWILIVGTFLHVFGLMMASISTEYYQLLLSQGVCSPLGASMIFYPTISASVTWFYHKRALALGIASTGSSVGGVILPIMVQRLIPEVGFPWTMRICAFLILFLMIIANLTIKSRIPPLLTPVKVMDFINPFKELTFALLSLASFLMFLGLFLPFDFIILEGLSRGVSPSIAIYLVPILNAASILGRTIPPYLADKLGRFTVFLSMALLTTIIVLALWLPSHGTGETIAFALIFGFSSGCIVSVLPTLVAQVSDVRQIGVRTGALFSCVALAVLVGSPIAGKIVSADGGKYWGLQVFSGVMMAAGTVCYAAVRVRVGGWSLTKKV